MVLLNICIANLSWVQPFDSERTQTGNFSVYSRKLNVNMMNQIQKYSMVNEEYARLLFIPINENKRQAVILLPQPRFSLDDSTMNCVNVKTPKFTLSSQQNLINALNYFGVTHLFESNNTDFRDIAGPGGFI
ncbi:hypothetical protein RF11_07096 [Thelohanellus kitauei]|uniref:Serpin domain-containing protein n=1 Tax=Thelohanellus kitauei TaxID=669202 RepID=A0A0C2MKS2_THEKT|nr:hypothetical protein RF11_07096 [Thelohanellus kitauei]